MIYVDETRDYGPAAQFCHMWSADGDENELHSFAAILGLKRNWVHHSSGLSGEFIHYDLRPSKRKQALKQGAHFKPLEEWIMERNPAHPLPTPSEGGE